MAQARRKSILVAISDPYRGKQLVLAKAAAIAMRWGAHVTLFNSFMVPSPPTGKSLDSSAKIIRTTIAERQKRLERLALRLRKLGVSVSCFATWDFPANEAIVRHVLETEPDLVMTESSRHGRFARWVLANTDWELIRTCPCPVWFVRSPALSKAAQLLVAVDPRHTHAKPSRLDDRLLSTARRMAKLLGARVSIGHAYELPVTSTPATMTEPIRLPIAPERARRFVNETKRLVARLAKKYSIDASRQFVRNGDATLVLPSLAKELKADVLVMGAVSRSRLLPAFIGNTAEKVIDHVACDVLVVKPANFKTSVTRRKPQL
jgi:universal stress protein E